jgi:hypothetical protein
VVLARKPVALDHAPVYRDWQLPVAIAELRQALEARLGPRTGAHHYIRVLQLFAGHPLDRVEQAILGCRARGQTDATAMPAPSNGWPVTHHCHPPHPRPLPSGCPSCPGSTCYSSVPTQETDPMSQTTPLLLKANLKQLKLPTMLAEHEKLAREAAERNEPYAGYLLHLTELEVAARAANALAARIRAATFPVLKEFDIFDFTACPSLPKQ